MNERHFEVHNQGSVVLLVPLSPVARTWVTEHVEVPSWAWWGGGFACEPRYIENILAGFAEDMDMER